MELAFTFGAVGDFIAVLELIQKIVAALDESRGSAKEYRDAVRSLQILERTIAHVKDVFSNQNPSMGHGDLRAIALCIVAKIKECLEDFCDKIWKFGPSLANGGTKNVLRDAARKMQWKFKQGDVEKLHNDLSRLTMPLNMILEMTSLREVRRGHDATSKQINDSESRTTAVIQDSNKSIMEQFGAFEQLVLTKLEVMSEFGTDSNQSAIQIIRMVNAVSKDLNGIKAMLMRLERPLNEEQFIFEDVSGKVFPIHLRTITSWEAFEFIITDRFKGKKGGRRIQRGNYSLQERATVRGVSRSVDWQSAFLPNQRVDMSMMYRQGQDATLMTSSASCPRCLAVSPGETGVEIQCTECNMFFTRVVELDDAPILPFAPTPPQSAHAPGGPPFANKGDGENDNASSNTPGRGSGGSSQPRRPSTEEESDSDDEDIQGFVRIMLISKAKNANRPASEPTGNLAEVLEAASQTNLRDPEAAVVSSEAEDSVKASPEAIGDDDELSEVSPESAQDTTIKQKDSEPEHNYDDDTMKRGYYYSQRELSPRRPEYSYDDGKTKKGYYYSRRELSPRR
ncbi:vegetative cell wall protein gp1 [Colletotrichum musicola]|uniref:Vegetative cell wall protein gp1 n=1 Tax=Colletotrichum musicola TaxID=2175873 RepID=A0A8H6JZT0_9PEZI|nr:vegetative cell wall protein gp1 [Colletotrichum musicola]